MGMDPKPFRVDPHPIPSPLPIDGGGNNDDDVLLPLLSSDTDDEDDDEGPPHLAPRIRIRGN